MKKWALLVRETVAALERSFPANFYKQNEVKNSQSIAGAQIYSRQIGMITELYCTIL